MREPNERASRNSRSFHRTKQWRSAKEKQRGNTGYLPRKSSLVFDDVSFGAWNRLNFKSTRCLEHFEMNTRPCYIYKRFETSRKCYETNDDDEKENIFWNEWWRTNWRKRYRWWNECEESKWYRRYGDWNSRGFGLILFIWNYVWKGEKENFVWGIEEFWLRNEILFEELKRLHW